jgi:2-oxo-3-hexenedioate decarboxylase
VADLVRELRTFTITLSTNGKVEAQGGGSNVLGSPLLAAAHFLSLLKDQRFEPLAAGELVTTGTLLPPPLIRACETWTTELSGIDLPGLQLRLE